MKKELETVKADLIKAQDELLQNSTEAIGTEPEETSAETVLDNKKYSRTSPAVIGDVIITEKEDWLIGKVKYEIELQEVTIGEDEWNIVKEANMFNEEPVEGKEYILAKFRVKVLETEGDEPFELNHAMFDIVSGKGIEYTGFNVVSGLNPDLSADLYKDAEHIVWTSFLVDKEDSNPLAVIDRKSENEIWFQLRYQFNLPQ
ncbi:MAG: DUF4352 domain-containing protein [Actinomycetia bacterium]|nr:DUF4352 domain-containing protein [Actinomycetota bacterium]MCG2788323.1 DUF4352 domain-containing protein [Actinomycetes bacterium]